MGQQTKSCANCKHLSSWDYPATREDPGDSGWECSNSDGFFWDEDNYVPAEFDNKSDPECMEIMARRFNHHFFYDHEEVLRQQAECDALHLKEMEEIRAAGYPDSYEPTLADIRD